MVVRLRFLALLSAALLVAGCAGMAVRTDRATDADIEAYESFAWRAPKRVDRDQRPVWDNAIFADRVRQAVESVLREKGYQRAEPSAADFLVTYSTTSRERVRGSSIGFGYWTHPVFIDQRVTLSSYEEGTLILDVIDADSEELVWRGWLAGYVDEHSNDAETVRRTVEHILDRFPSR